jgi:flagellin-like protein
MRRAHRAFHRAIWPILAVVVALGFVLALALRPPPEPEAPAAAPPAQEQR